MKLSVEGLNKIYGRELRVLTDLSLSAYGGQICGIVGENGAGKTTFADIMTRRCLADSGRVDLQIGGVTHNLLADKGFVGLIPQRPRVVDTFNAVDNIFLGQELAGGPLRPIRFGTETEVTKVWSQLLFPVPRGPGSR